MKETAATRVLRSLEPLVGTGRRKHHGMSRRSDGPSRHSTGSRAELSSFNTRILRRTKRRETWSAISRETQSKESSSPGSRRSTTPPHCAHTGVGASCSRGHSGGPAGG
jgi:hypothetical protein